MPQEFSFVSCDKENVIIETIKQAEDSSGIIIRLFECHNRRTVCELTFGIAVKSVRKCSMLEEEEEQLVVEDGRKVGIAVKPYEILTLKAGYHE